MQIQMEILWKVGSAHISGGGRSVHQMPTSPRSLARSGSGAPSPTPSLGVPSLPFVLYLGQQWPVLFNLVSITTWCLACFSLPPLERSLCGIILAVKPLSDVQLLLENGIR